MGVRFVVRNGVEYLEWDPVGAEVARLAAEFMNGVKADDSEVGHEMNTGRHLASSSSLDKQNALSGDKTMTATTTQNVLAIHRLRINVKSLAEESRIVRKEVRRAGPEWRNRLAVHRQCRVKPESRLAQLALAFVRGKSYRSVEQSTNRPVCPRVLEKKLHRFGVFPSLATIREWLETGR